MYDAETAETTLSSSAFQIVAAGTGKAWLPMVSRLKEVTARRLV